LTGYTRKAVRQVESLRQHYEDLGRPEALHAFEAALEAAELRIDTHPNIGLPAPRPYPHLARPGYLWIKSGRYWITFSTELPPVIGGVFFETSDIPHRV
jgi:plasmid stabilization system protein ParE